MTLHIKAFFDSATGTISYVVFDEPNGSCAIIDPVLDYDPKSSRTSTHSADGIIEFIRQQQLSVDWILETHVHADHLSAAPYIRDRLGGRTAIGSQVTTVQRVFGKIFNAEASFSCDGRQFDVLLQDGASLSIGSIDVTAMHTPGHTPACMTYVARSGNTVAAFVGDTLFMPDSGTARCDFPGGDASILYRSIKRVLSLPENTTLYMCHDYQPGGRELSYTATVAEERERNIHVRNGISEEEFVAMRTKRDAQLAMPALMLPSVQINMRGGELPPPEVNGERYLKIPLNVL